jgi:hypothetical protein
MKELTTFSQFFRLHYVMVFYANRYNLSIKSPRVSPGHCNSKSLYQATGMERSRQQCDVTDIDSGK